MEKDKKIIYKINVVPANSKITLTFIVDGYETLEGGIIRFFDKKRRVHKIFDLRLCEIDEIEVENNGDRDR